MGAGYAQRMLGPLGDCCLPTVALCAVDTIWFATRRSGSDGGRVCKWGRGSAATFALSR